MTEIKKRKRSTPEWEATFIPDPFGSSAFRRSIEQKIDTLDEGLKPILKEILPNHNYENFRKSAIADIKEGRAADASLPVLLEIATYDDSPETTNAVFALYYTALAEIENSSGNTENALKALLEANYLYGFITGHQYVAAEFKGEKRSSLGRPGGKKRQEMIKRITEEAARLLTDLAPPEGWRLKIEATNAIQDSLDNFIKKEGLENIVTQTFEFLRRGYSTKDLIKEAFQLNSAKGRNSAQN